MLGFPQTPGQVSEGDIVQIWYTDDVACDDVACDDVACDDVACDDVACDDVAGTSISQSADAPDRYEMAPASAPCRARLIPFCKAEVKPVCAPTLLTTAVPLPSRTLSDRVGWDR